jgi:hypothetical protein
MLSFASPPAIVVAISRSPAAPTEQLIARGTTFPVELASAVSSRTAQVGDFFSFRTLADFRVHDRVVVPRGTPGMGIVVEVSRARAHSHGGRLVLEARSLRLPDGEQLQVTLDRGANALSLAWNSRPPPWFTRFIPHFGEVLTAFSYLRNGKDVEAKRGTVFVVSVISDTALRVENEVTKQQAVRRP